MINEGLGSRKNQSQSLVTVGQSCHSLESVCDCVCVCVTFITAGHWGSLLTVDPSLDHTTPAWPLCLAPTAEQRVLLAQAADWWLSSPLLAKSLDLCLSTTGQSRMGQQGRLNVTNMHKYYALVGACNMQLICRWSLFFLWVLTFNYWYVKCPIVYLSAYLTLWHNTIWYCDNWQCKCSEWESIRSKKQTNHTELKLGFWLKALTSTSYLSRALTNGTNWPKPEQGL